MATCSVGSLHGQLRGSPFMFDTEASRRGPRQRGLHVSATIIPRFFFEPPQPYPHKLGRRPEEPPPRRKVPARLPKPPKLPNPATAKALVAIIDGGLPTVVERAKSLAEQGRWTAAIEMASLAVAVSPKDAPVVRVRDEIVHAASMHGMMLSWRKARLQVAIAQAASDDAFEERSTTEAKWFKVKPKDRKSNTSKPRQGWTKAQMRLFTVRMCVCCRGLFPREDLWRITHDPLSGASAPGAVPGRADSGAEASSSAAQHRTAAQKAGGAEAQKRPKRPLPQQGQRDEKGGKGGADRGRPGGRLVIESPELGPHAEAGDGGVWGRSGVRAPGARSAYVCRKGTCVSFAVGRKARNPEASAVPLQPFPLSPTFLSSSADGNRPISVPAGLRHQALARASLGALVTRELGEALTAATAEWEPRAAEEAERDRAAVEALFAQFSSLLPAASAALAGAEASTDEDEKPGGGGAGKQGEPDTSRTAGGAVAGSPELLSASERPAAAAAVLEQSPSLGSQPDHQQPLPTLAGFSLRDAVDEVSAEVAAGPQPRGAPGDWRIRKMIARASVAGPEAKGPTRRAAVLRQALESILSAAPEAEPAVRALIEQEVERVRRVPRLTEEGVQRKAEMRVVLRLLKPALRVIPMAQMRGPHDRWEGLPEGPR